MAKESDKTKPTNNPLRQFTDGTPRHPSVQNILQFFRYLHLPEQLQPRSKPFHDMAIWLADTTPQNPELTVALRKLRESKDCAVTAHVFEPPIFAITSPGPEDSGKPSDI